MGFVITSGSHRWRGHKVPFVIDDSIREIPVDFGAVSLAIEVWNANTCVPFTPKTDLDTDFVEFIRHDKGCQSPVGRQGGPQQIKCDFASAASNPFLREGEADAARDGSRSGPATRASTTRS